MADLVGNNILVDVQPKKQDGQKSLNFEDAWLARYAPYWSRPGLVDGNLWRRVVKQQPIAELYRDTLIQNAISLDWKISVRDTDKQDELAATVRHYTTLLEKGGNSGLDWTSLLEWVAKDLLDTPFGGAVEIGRKGDSPIGRVQWIEPIDSATLFPTLNYDFPIVQEYNTQSVAFPAHSIARVYMSPRTEMQYRGWGTPPPEVVYNALQLLTRGDMYYANLLLDIPAAGILDLGDMEQSSALEWVEAYKGFLANGGNTSFKIPVLYEHATEVKFISFGKAPNDLMYDRITLKYAALVGAAYGLGLADIGLQAATGESLAGTIRSDRRTRSTGRARLKKKLKYFYEQILPPTLRFDWVDYDDELNVALGRARLANATAMQTLTNMKAVTPEEARKQLISDGMFTISMPESVPDYDWPDEEKPAQRVGNEDQEEMRGDPVPASAGGEGEIRKSTLVATYAVFNAGEILRTTIIENEDYPDIAKWETTKMIEMAEVPEELEEAEYKSCLVKLRDMLLENSNVDDYNSLVPQLCEIL